MGRGDEEVRADLRAALRTQLPHGEVDDERAAQQTHDALVALDLFRLELPFDADGLDLGVSSGGVVCEELGRRALRDEYRATALLADVLRYGDRAMAASLLPRVAAGALVAAAGPATDVIAGASPDGPTMRGRATVIDPLARASVVVVTAPVDHHPTAVALPLDHVGVAVGPVSATGASVVDFESVPPLATVCLEVAGRPVSPVLTHMRLRQGAYLIGLAALAHDLAIDRAATRRQFDRPIEKFQGVAFPLAAARARLAALRLLMRRAAWLADEHDDGAELAAIEALASAAELALSLSRDNLHVHGAYGLTAASRAGQLFRVVTEEAVRWGAPSRLWRRAGSIRLGAP